MLPIASAASSLAERACNTGGAFLVDGRRRAAVAEGAREQAARETTHRLVLGLLLAFPVQPAREVLVELLQL